MLSSVDCITTTSASEFSVHTGGASRTDGPVERGHLGNRSSGYYEEAFVFSALLAGICLPTTFLRAS
jgi:hypothetical protein